MPTSIKFDPNDWLRRSLGDEKHSPLEVDAFEFGQAARAIRMQISRQVDPEQRRAEIDELKQHIFGDERFVRISGEGVQYKFKRLFNDQQQPVGSSRVDLQACKLEYSIVSPK